MARFARVVAMVAALFMAGVLVWDGARSLMMGADYTLYGAADRPASLVGRHWPADMMKKWAHDFDVDVIASGDAARPGVVVGYPAHHGSEYDRWVTDGYPCLNNCRLKARSLDRDPKAIETYQVGVSELSFMGSRADEAAEAARAYYDSLGWRTGVQDLNSQNYWLTQFAQLFQQAFVCVMLLIVVLTAAHVLTRSKTVGVQLLLGSTRSQLLASDLLVWTATYLAVALGTLCLGFVVSLATVHGHFFIYIARAFGALAFAFLVAGAVGHAVAHQVLRATGIIEALKGRVRFGLTFPLVYALRSLVVLMCASLLVLLNQTALTLRQNENLSGQLGPMAGYSAYGTLQGIADDPTRRHAVADEMRRLYREGTFAMASAQPQFFTIDSQGIDLTVREGGDQMVATVNTRYLSLHHVTTPSGRPLDLAADLDPNAMTVLFPVGTSERVRAQVVKYTAKQLDGDAEGRVPGLNDARAPIREMPVAAGAQYVMETDDGPAHVVNPILIVYPDRFVPGDDFVSTSGLFVRNDAIDDIRAKAPHFAGAGVFDSTTSRVAQQVESGREESVRQTFELASYLLLLPLATIGIVLMYARQNARRIFVQTLAGRPLYELAPLILALEAVSLGVIAWYSRPRPPTLEQLHVFGAQTSSVPWYIFGAALLVFGLILGGEYAMFRRVQRRTLVARGAEL